MILFDNAEYNSFFNPLCCKNKRIYYECILLLIEKSKSVPLLYETDAKDALILYFINCAYAVEDEAASGNADENISSKKTENENASAILRYFRHCGWISEKEIGRNGDNIATVMPYCRKVIEAIERIFNRDNRAALTNHIFSIYDILSSAYIADHGRTHRPYSNILVPMMDNVADLKNELLILKDSIRSIMRMIIKMTETNALGQFLIRDEMLEHFFNDYFFIKKDGLIPGYIEEIEKMLRKIVKTEAYENMIKEYQSFYNTDEIAAHEMVDGQLAEVKSFISYDYVKEMDYIDNKINNYYSLYSTRILMVLSNSVNMQTYLNDLLMTIKDFDAKEKEEILEAVSQCYALQSYKYVGRKSIERRKKCKPNIKSGAIIKSSLSDEDKARLTRELLYEYPDRYGVKQAASYFEKVLTGKDSVVPDETMIKTRDDAMMVAASIIYCGSLEFPYEVEFLEGTIDTEVATISNVRIKRKM
ncbi:MAG: chromosome segregation protein SMC [Lachnospiraceae bacterium]|nr:chromosome segregation protein SMC [Lachnospiraceae bacterium]